MDAVSILDCLLIVDSMRLYLSQYPSPCLSFFSVVFALPYRCAATTCMHGLRLRHLQIGEPENNGTNHVLSKIIFVAVRWKVRKVQTYLRIAKQWQKRKKGLSEYLFVSLPWTTRGNEMNFQWETKCGFRNAACFDSMRVSFLEISEGEDCGGHGFC